MKIIDFEKLKQEIIELLQQKKSLVLATASNNRVRFWKHLIIKIIQYNTNTSFNG